jgi:hypothetical protein
MEWAIGEECHDPAQEEEHQQGQANRTSGGVTRHESFDAAATQEGTAGTRARD